MHSFGNRPAKPLQECLAAFIRNLIWQQEPDWKIGFLIHALGDSFAHTYVDGLGVRRLYNKVVGHGLTGFEPDKLLDPHAVDDVNHDPQNYQDYVRTLYSAIGGEPVAPDVDANLTLNVYLPVEDVQGKERIEQSSALGDRWIGKDRIYKPEERHYETRYNEAGKSFRALGDDWNVTDQYQSNGKTYLRSIPTHDPSCEIPAGDQASLLRWMSETWRRNGVRTVGFGVLAVVALECVASCFIGRSERPHLEFESLGSPRPGEFRLLVSSVVARVPGAYEAYSHTTGLIYRALYLLDYSKTSGGHFELNRTVGPLGGPWDRVGPAYLVTYAESGGAVSLSPGGEVRRFTRERTGGVRHDVLVSSRSERWRKRAVSAVHRSTEASVREISGEYVVEPNGSVWRQTDGATVDDPWFARVVKEARVLGELQYCPGLNCVVGYSSSADAGNGVYFLRGEDEGKPFVLFPGVARETHFQPFVQGGHIRAIYMTDRRIFVADAMGEIIGEIAARPVGQDRLAGIWGIYGRSANNWPMFVNNRFIFWWERDGREDRASVLVWNVQSGTSELSEIDFSQAFGLEGERFVPKQVVSVSGQ